MIALMRLMGSVWLIIPTLRIVGITTPSNSPVFHIFSLQYLSMLIWRLVWKLHQCKMFILHPSTCLMLRRPASVLLIEVLILRMRASLLINKSCVVFVDWHTLHISFRRFDIHLSIPHNRLSRIYRGVQWLIMWCHHVAQEILFGHLLLLEATIV